jgi:quercetin dioxygenase-like cupin family protein
VSPRRPAPPPADPDVALTAALDSGEAPDDPALRDALADLAWALVAVAPRTQLRDRLLAAAGGGRLEPFTSRLAALFDLGLDRAREVLAWVEDPHRWLPAVPGVALVHVRGGPAVAGADCGLVRVAPGVGFPWHAHHAEERTLFVAGVCRDHAGAVYRPGDELVLAAGSAHAFTSVGDTELVLGVRHRGVDFTAPRPPG